MHVLGVVVICEVVSILDAPVHISPVGPVFPVFPFRGVVGVDNVTTQFGLQLLAAFAHFVPVNLLQLVWLQHVHLRLLLHIGGSQVLFGVVVSSEGSALAHETGPAKDQQQDQEENSTHCPAHYSTQAAVRDGGQGRGGEQGSLPAQVSVRSGGVMEEGSSGAADCRGGGRICRTNVIKWFKPDSKCSEEL